MQTHNDSETFLRQYHAQYTGVTSKMLTARTSDGRSSYELLAQLIPDRDQPLTVLDLACGDGPLLELLLQRKQPRLTLIGVDMSPEELALARQRLGAGRVDLRLERAQQLSLADASVDYVVSHLALMLMDPIEEVVSEIRRVLKPGGVCAAIVIGEFVPGDAREAFNLAARDLLHQAGMGDTTLGDRRVSSVEGLNSLFRAATGFDAPITTENFILRLDGTIEQVKDILLRTYIAYLVGLVSPDRLTALEARTMEILKAFQREDGTVPFALGLRLVLCRKRAG